MKRKIVIVAVLALILLMSIPSISAVEHKNVEKKLITENLSHLSEIKNVWLKIMLYSMFTGLLVILAMIFGTTAG